MSKLQIVQLKDNEFAVYLSQTQIGSVRISKNLYHEKHTYVALFLDYYDTAFASELFTLLQEKICEPLQIAVYSFDRTITEFLLAGGFELKRRCYDIEITSKELSSADSIENSFFVIDKNDSAYLECCQRVYSYYKSTHQNISPLTASFDMFCKILSDTVFCELDADQIVHLAFVSFDGEDYGIDYMHSINPDHFSEFGKKLLVYLASNSIRVTFECDDCDPLSMQLKACLKVECDVGYNTYILPLQPSSNE